jgi:hypothetical protein
MKIERTFTADAGEAIALEHAVTFLRQSGYKQVSSGPFLVFQRGSALGSFISPNPKSWKAKATIQVIPDVNQVKSVAVLTFDITGQFVTGKERAFWDNEVNDLEAAIHIGKVTPLTGSKIARSALRQNIAAAVSFLSLVLVLAITARCMFDSRLAYYIGGIFGVVLGLVITRIWIRWKIY